MEAVIHQVIEKSCIIKYKTVPWCSKEHFLICIILSVNWVLNNTDSVCTQTALSVDTMHSMDTMKLWITRFPSF